MWLTKAGKQGSKEDHYELGAINFYTDQKNINYPETIYWWTKAAEENHAEAQYELGVLYRYGNGTPINLKKTVELWQKSAAQGLKEAQFGLGVLHYYGEGVEQNFMTAASWFTKAVEQNHPEAKYNLGIMHYYGLGGLPHDQLKAIELLQQAAQQGIEEAQNALILIVENFNKTIFNLYSLSINNTTIKQQNEQSTIYTTNSHSIKNKP